MYSKSYFGILHVRRYSISDENILLSDYTRARKKIFCIQYELIGVVVYRKIFRIISPVHGDTRVSVVKSKERIRHYLLEYTLKSQYFAIHRNPKTLGPVMRAS